MTYTGTSGAQTQPMLGRYRLIREIARSNDIVWEGVDPQVNRRVAVKELALDPSVTGQARRHRIERFYREARAAGAMNHPNIVTIYEVGEDRGRYFIAMEFLDGITLRERLSLGGALAVQEAVEITQALCDALLYAHDRGVIHRDIKPDNIFLLRPDNRVKLADFGIARITHETQLTVAGQIFGTPAYMSPEQVLGKEIDARSDIFSLGIVLYEMVTGRKPFSGDSVVTITYRIMHEPTPAVLGASPALDSVIQRATAKNPADRYASATEFRAALQQAVQDWRTGQTLPPGVRPLTYAAAPTSTTGIPNSTAAYGVVTRQGMPGVASPEMALPTGPVAPPLPVSPPVPAPEPRRNPMPLLLALGFFAFVVLLGFSAFSTAFTRFAKTSSGGPGADFDKAASLYNAGRYAEAAPLFRQAGKNKEAAWCYIAMGQQAEDLKDYARAKEMYTLALAANPADPQAQQKLTALQKLEGAAVSGNLPDSERGNLPRAPSPPPVIPVKDLPATTPYQGAATTNEWNNELQRKASAAQASLGQGDTLYQQNNLKDACRAWNDAVATAPGSQAARTAQERYNQYCGQVPLFGSGS